MDEPMSARLRFLFDNPLNCYPAPGALLDTWIILCIKIEHKPSKELIDERDDIEISLRRKLSGVSERVKLLELVKKLTEFHREMWKMEDQVRNPTLPITTRQHIALDADMLNDERARLKTEINKLFGYKPGSEAKLRASTS